ncbi:MAG: hypothetical protein R6V06_04095 [Kiritimatiellia bacterium]
MKTLNVWIRSDDGFSNSHLDETTFDSSGWTLLASDMRLLQNPGGTTQTVHNALGLTDVSGRYIALDVNTSYGYYDYPALGEVLFFCEPVPPAPKGTVVLIL